MPAYNEERRIEPSLTRIVRFLSPRAATAEVIVVENGSTDRTAAVVERFAAAHPIVRMLRTGKGKGRAVQAGILGAQGRILLLCDADLSMAIEEADRLIAPCERHYNLTIGSREGAAARRIGEPPYRHMMGRGFNWLARLLTVRGIQDTQCGFKAFQRDAARIVFADLTIGGWAFDVEALFLAQRHGFSILEVPITWRFDADSRVQPIADTCRMVRDVLRIRGNAWIGRYSAPRTAASHEATPC